MLWDSVQEDLEGSPTTEQIEEERDSRTPSSAPSARSADDLKADLLSVREPEQPPRPRGGGGGARPARPLTQQERDDKVRHDYELATEIAQRIYATDPSGQESAGAPASGQEEPAPERITVPASTQRSSSSLSSLDDGWGGGLSSLDSSEGAFPQDDSRPYRCMFTRDEKIRSGQRVTLRLLEDMAVDGVVIPANAHITAVCSIRDRLLVSVTSFEMNGRIHTLDFAGYDNDGALGIYCPGVNDSAAKTARNDAMDLGRGVARSRIGAVANGLLSTGVTIAKAAGSGEQSVTVPAGYTFLHNEEHKEMRRLFLTVIAAALTGAAAYAQTDTLRLSTLYTTHVIFPTELIYADLSNNRIVAAKIIEQNKNMLALKAREPFEISTSIRMTW